MVEKGQHIYNYSDEGFTCPDCGKEFKDRSLDMGGICQDCYSK